PIPDSDAEAPDAATAIDLLLAALAGGGWAPDDGEVELLPPPAVGGGRGGGPAPPPPGRVQAPRAERAEELRRRWAPSSSADRTAEPRTPLMPEPVRTASAGHLSYSALADYAGCGYRFYVERVLGLASPLSPGDADGDAPEADAAEADE